jgi:excinuclease ABC subunit A
LYAEGQRRYVESLSSYARQFLEGDKPKVEYIKGIAQQLPLSKK